MDIPSPGVVRDSGTNFDQAFDEPVHGTLNILAPDIEPTDHMQEIVGQNPHLQPGLVGFKALAAGLVPAQGIFPLLDPVFHVAPAIVNFDHFTGWKSRSVLPSRPFIRDSHHFFPQWEIIYRFGLKWLDNWEKTSILAEIAPSPSRS